MGFFSSLFGKKEEKKVYVVEDLATFIYDGEHFNIHRWVCDIKETNISVIGDAEKPYQDQIEFVKNLDSTFEKLQQIITDKIIELYNNAALEIDFNSWKEEFTLVSVDLDNLNSTNIWLFTLEEKKETSAHFNFEIKDNEILGVSIDT